MPVNLDAIHALPQGGPEFFLIFTRCEFAMKDAGLYVVNGNQVKAHWERFAEEVGGERFHAFVRQSGAARELFEEPPRKQIEQRIAGNGVLVWQAQPPVEDVHGLFRAVKCVRNNLVHGSKGEHPDEDRERRARGRRLIAEARWVLIQALERHDNVRGSFERA